MRKFIRKVAAVGAGVAMLGSTLGGAMAADLSDLPSPFVTSGSYQDTAFVVGAKAGTNDNAARTTLTGYFNPFVDTEAGAIVSSSDTEKIYFGENLTQEFQADLDDGDISALWDDGIDFRGSNYETSEHVLVSSNDVAWVAVSGLTAEEELSLNPELYTNGDNLSWGYRYVFDETMTDNVSTDHELGITFLGKNFRISDTVSATNAVTMTTGDQVSIGQDASLDAGNGHTIYVGTIFETKVEVWVDSESHKFLDEGDEETFYVGSDNVEVKIDDIGYTDDVASRTALITYGEDISTTVTNGDAVQTELGEPDVDDKAGDATWNWDISVTTNDIFTNGDYLGIYWNQKVSKWNDVPAPLKSGEYWATPYGYITLDFSVVEPNYQEYTFEFESLKTINSSIEEDVLVITANGRAGENDGIDIGGTDTDQVAINNSGYVYYMDNDGDWQGGGYANSTTCGTGLCIEPSSDTTKYVALYNLTGGFPSTVTDTVAYMKIQDVESGDDNTYNGGYLQSNISITNERLGATQGTAEAGDLYYYRVANPALTSATLTEVQSWDDGGLMTAYGIKVTGLSGSEDIKSAIENDEIYLWVPEDEAYGEVSFNVRSTAASAEPVLTTESGAASYDNLILVGGPCVNSLTAQYMGLSYPSCEVASTIEANTAIIQLVEEGSKTVLIVAGWEKADTARAASTVAAGGLTGTTMEV